MRDAERMIEAGNWGRRLRRFTPGHRVLSVALALAATGVFGVVLPATTAGAENGLAEELFDDFSGSLDAAWEFRDGYATTVSVRR